MSFWWLPFVDPALPVGSRFLGACIVEIEGVVGETRIQQMQRAHQAAWTHGCNPGGAIRAHEIREDAGKRVPRKWVHRLLTRAECEALERELAAIAAN